MFGEVKKYILELVPWNQTINLNVYRRQLDKLNSAIKKKRSEFVNCKDVTFRQKR